MLAHGSRVKGRFGSQYDVPVAVVHVRRRAGHGQDDRARRIPACAFRSPSGSATQAIGGVGGTRNCDWWFTDDAVLLDTAGRFTTQDSFAEADEAAWSGFLQLLRKYRPRRPLNGVIVVLSVPDLLQLDDARQRRAGVRRVRDRLNELYTQLGMRFPVYVVVTKCDLLAGFAEFFDDLGREEREQVWGMTFPFTENATRGSGARRDFPAEFSALGKAVAGACCSACSRRPTRAGARSIYAFSAAVRGAPGRRCSDSSTKRSASSRFEHSRRCLRGVYFTSGTQKGRPIDRMMSAMAAALGLQREVLLPRSSSGRAYFIKRLLRDVIFAGGGACGHQSAAGAPPRVAAARRRSADRRAAGAGAGRLRHELPSATARSSRTCSQQMRRLQQDGAGAPRRPTIRSRCCRCSNGARDLPGGYADRGQDRAPWLSRLGLVSGRQARAGSAGALSAAVAADLAAADRRAGMDGANCGAATRTIAEHAIRSAARLPDARRSRALRRGRGAPLGGHRLAARPAARRDRRPSARRSTASGRALRPARLRSVAAARPRPDRAGACDARENAAGAARLQPREARTRPGEAAGIQRRERGRAATRRSCSRAEAARRSRAACRAPTRARAIASSCSCATRRSSMSRRTTGCSRGRSRC